MWQDTISKGNLKNFYNSKVFSDCQIILCQTMEVLQTHRIILSSNSTVFQRIFDYDFQLIDSPQILIKDVSSAVAKIFVQHCYGIEPDISFTYKDWFDLYKMADMYLVQPLMDRCLSKLKTCSLDKDSAYDLLKMAVKYNFEHIAIISLQFGKRHCDKDAKWIRLVKTKPFLLKEWEKEPLSFFSTRFSLYDYDRD